MNKEIKKLLKKLYTAVENEDNSPKAQKLRSLFNKALIQLEKFERTIESIEVECKIKEQNEEEKKEWLVIFDNNEDDPTTYDGTLDDVKEDITQDGYRITQIKIKEHKIYID